MTHGLRFSRKEAAALALGYAIVAFAAFRAVLRSGFLADDWLFLGFVVPARSIAVCFDPLVGFVRPMVMLTYYVNHRLFGLSTLPYHVTVVAVHVATACLVAALALRATGSKHVAAWSGLLFVAFAGHAEAVGWVAGAADPWLAVFLLTGLLLFARGLEADRPLWPLTAAVLVLTAAYLAKESAAIGVGLVAAWGGSRAVFGDRANARRVLIRTAVVVGPLACATVLYLVMRSQVFGSALGGYNTLNADRSIFFQQFVAFLLRSFFPPSLSFVDASRRWLGLEIIVAAAATTMIATRRQDRAGAAFLWAAFAIALAPVLPLTISLHNSTSERFVYVPTAFSCILTAWTISLACGRRQGVAAVALAAVVAAQYPALARSKAERLEAAGLFQAFMADVVALVRSEASSNTSRVFFLTLPDSLRGTIVSRNAFHPALGVLAPDFTDREWRATFFASHDLHTTRDRTTVQAEGPNRFRVAIQAGHFLESRPPDNPEFAILEWSSTGYVIDFKPSRWRRIVVYESEGRLHKAGGIESGAIDGVPFGVVDIPADGAVCDEPTLRFSGWALDDEPGMEVILSREATPGVWTQLGRAEYRAGTRPDVEAMFAGYPHANRAEWDYRLPCSPAGSERGMRLRIVARDSAGQETALGERTINLPGRGR